MAYRNGHAGVGQAGLPAPSQRFDILLDEARPCMRRAWIPGVAASRMHLLAEKLTHRRRAQLGLFEPDTGRAEAVARLKRHRSNTPPDGSA